MTMPVQITILVDNRALPGLMAEHGLALWIETDDRRVLFDTGQGSALVPNAATLGANLAETDTMILSHGHYDHVGGVAQVLQRAGRVEVYCHPAAVLPRYGIRDGASKPIHMQTASSSALDALPLPRLHWVQRPLPLTENLGLTGPIPRESAFEDAGGSFYLDRNGRQADPIEDDLALWIRTGKGLVVCVGCCHAGLLNTLHYVQRLNHGMKLHAVIGGFHLLGASGERLESTIAELRSLEMERVIPCHCTGDQAAAAILDALDRGGECGAAGMKFSF